MVIDQYETKDEEAFQSRKAGRQAGGPHIRWSKGASEGREKGNGEGKYDGEERVERRDSTQARRGAKEEHARAFEHEALTCARARASASVRVRALVFGGTPLAPSLPSADD